MTKFTATGNISLNKSNNNNSNETTFDVGIRVSNHVRNMIESLKKLGIANSDNSLISELVENKVNNLKTSQYKEFVRTTKILEKKDALNYEIRH